MPPPAEGLASRLVLGPALRTQPDRRLVRLVREGYEAAFEEIVRRYAKPLARYAGAIVGGRAEDVTQDAFSKALEALRRDEAEIDLRPWLYRIVRNTALNDLRDRPEEAEELAESIAGGRTAAEVAEQREQLSELIEGLRALPEPQRAAIVMRELEGLSHEEIAAALGLSGGGARQAIYRARQALRDGAALLLPLPFLRFLIEHGGEATTAGAVGGAGGAVVAATGASGAGAGGVALKAGVVAAVLAGSVGTGVALRDGDGGKTAGAAVPATRSVAPGPVPVSTRPAPIGGSTEEDSSRDDRGEHGGHRSGNADQGRDRGAREGEGKGERHGGPGGHPGRDRARGHARGGHKQRPPHLREGHGGSGNGSHRDRGSPRPGRHEDRPGHGGGNRHGGERHEGSRQAGGGPGPSSPQPPPPPPPPEPEEEDETPEREDGGEAGDSAPGDGSRDLAP